MIAHASSIAHRRHISSAGPAALLSRYLIGRKTDDDYDYGMYSDKDERISTQPMEDENSDADQPKDCRSGAEDEKRLA